MSEHNLRECPAMRALESLTPSGSEFIDDIPRCVANVRRSREVVHEVLVRTKMENNELRSDKERLEKALDQAQGLAEAILKGADDAKGGKHAALRIWAKRYSVHDGYARTSWMERVERCCEAVVSEARASLSSPPDKEKPNG